MLMNYRIANNQDASKLKQLFMKVEAAVSNKAMFLWPNDMIDREIVESLFYVAESNENQDIVAFISFRMSETDQGDVIDIISLGTLPKLQGKGIMTEMLQSFARFFGKKSTTLFLEVHPDNKNAIKVYNNLGFKVSRVRKSYYSDGKDCLEMSCQLGG